MNELCGSSSSSTSNVAYRIELKPHNGIRSIRRIETKTYGVRGQRTHSETEEEEIWKPKKTMVSRAVVFHCWLCVCVSMSIRNRFEQVLGRDAMHTLHSDRNNNTKKKMRVCAKEITNKIRKSSMITRHRRTHNTSAMHSLTALVAHRGHKPPKPLHADVWYSYGNKNAEAMEIERIEQRLEEEEENNWANEKKYNNRILHSLRSGRLSYSSIPCTQHSKDIL